jgi:mercuric reductase
MCAIDAVAVAPMFNTKVSIHSRCPVSGAEVAVKMSGSAILELMPGPDVQIGVWWREPGAVAAKNFCPGVMFLRDIAAARTWQGGRSSDHDFASIAEAVQVAERFFRPLMLDAPVVALA